MNMTESTRKPTSGGDVAQVSSANAIAISTASNGAGLTDVFHAKRQTFSNLDSDMQPKPMFVSPQGQKQFMKQRCRLQSRDGTTNQRRKRFI